MAEASEVPVNKHVYVVVVSQTVVEVTDRARLSAFLSSFRCVLRYGVACPRSEDLNCTMTQPITLALFSLCIHCAVASARAEAHCGEVPEEYERRHLLSNRDGYEIHCCAQHLPCFRHSDPWTAAAHHDMAGYKSSDYPTKVRLFHSVQLIKRHAWVQVPPVLITEYFAAIHGTTSFTTYIGTRDRLLVSFSPLR